MRLTATRPSLLDELAAGPAEALRSSLAGLGFEDAVAFGRARGGTSTCYFVRATGPAGTEEFVCKCPLPGESIENEWQVLNDAATADGLVMRLPRPVALLRGGAGYLMERLPGDPLLRSPGLARAPERAALANRVIADLRSFHAALQHGFGDFHARNVLVGRRGTGSRGVHACGLRLCRPARQPASREPMADEAGERSDGRARALDTSPRHPPRGQPPGRPSRWSASLRASAMMVSVTVEAPPVGKTALLAT